MPAIAYLCAALLIGIAVAAQPPIWPAPQQATWGNTNADISMHEFQFVGDTKLEIIAHALPRFMELLFPHQSDAQSGAIKSLNIRVSNWDDVNLQLETSEAYTLTIPTSGQALLVADNAFGALRGLETFSQLVHFNFTSESYFLAQAPWNIKDFPRFAHRGLLLDTSRHFQPLPNIYRMIDGMACAKLNVLHWHIVDEQSFPFESKKYPALWQGAYSESERYTQHDVAAVVQFAYERGIRVMVEFDMPGHAASWCVGYPGVCPSPQCRTPLDPSTNATFDLIDGLLSEVTGSQRGRGLFFDNFLHLGGDEVDESCWSSTPHVQQWLTQKGFTTEDAYMYFLQRVHEIAIAQGRDPVNWEEVFNHFGSKLDKQTIVHVWLDHATLAKVVAAGYRGLLSNNDVWYLDHLGTTWQEFYLNEPLQNISDPAQQKLVLGGEVCMWGETVDASDLFNTVWPRAAAAAERLWSDRSLTDTGAALPRLEAFRCLLDRRGVPAAPVNNVLARAGPPGPGSCYAQ